VRILLAALVGLIGGDVATAQAQDAGPLVLSVELSADTVAIGDALELRLTIALAPERVAYFPDSLDSTAGLVPLGPVEWTAEATPDGGIRLSVVYPLLALGLGFEAIPDFEIFTASGRSNPTRRTATPVDRVGSWSAIVDARGQLPSLRRESVPSQRLWVASVLMLDDISQGIEPRPAADVIGADWHWPSALLIVGFTLAIGGVLTVSARDLFDRTNGRVSRPASPSLSPRLAALAALDHLLELGLHTDGRVDEFYRRGSDIVRRYVETLDPRWGSDQTSTELMRALDERQDRRADPALLIGMKSAETVKFGRLRPAPSDAESHWQTLRLWIEHDGKPNQ
jgi:hypothetical protein